jgi:hypothetical protein
LIKKKKISGIKRHESSNCCAKFKKIKLPNNWTLSSNVGGDEISPENDGRSIKSIADWIEFISN